MKLFDYFINKAKSSKLIKKSPKDIIQSKDYFEHAYVKFPGMELVPADLDSRISHVVFDQNIIRKLYKQSKKAYTAIHTHPFESSDDLTLPSDKDFIKFLGNDDIKSMVIVPQYKIGGEATGFFVFRKRKSTPKSRLSMIRGENVVDYISGDRYSSSIPNETLSKIKSVANEYKKQVMSGIQEGQEYHAMKNIAEEFNLNTRFIPAEGYRFNKRTASFEPISEFDKVLEGLEKKVVGWICFTSLITSILISSSSITGHSISLISQAPKFTGIILFFIGIISFVVFKHLYTKNLNKLVSKLISKPQNL